MDPSWSTLVNIITELQQEKRDVKMAFEKRRIDDTADRGAWQRTIKKCRADASIERVVGEQAILKAIFKVIFKAIFKAILKTLG
ncbi:hypothetical protein BLS_002212 [Venturia inaequalis]|uniref:Uncharacterized protein n=1 Tax=Venturia inaequalis TaxID=5025 RepID=A0A8H3VAT0_VENIN|nr:hypothetical protein BLS_002212 [Venturia inaequalis]